MPKYEGISEKEICLWKNFIVNFCKRILRGFSEYDLAYFVMSLHELITVYTGYLNYVKKHGSSSNSSKGFMGGVGIVRGYIESDICLEGDGNLVPVWSLTQSANNIRHHAYNNKDSIKQYRKLIKQYKDTYFAILKNIFGNDYDLVRNAVMSMYNYITEKDYISCKQRVKDLLKVTDVGHSKYSVGEVRDILIKEGYCPSDIDSCIVKVVSREYVA